MIKNLKRQEGFTRQKSNGFSGGFTIIEVMIVLVIAAVILLIVFLAVPALQRNSRNTQRKNEVASLLSAMSEWTNNNGGTFPATCGATAAAGGTAGTACGNFENNAKTSIYNLATHIGFSNNASAPATIPGVTKTDYVVLASFLKCNTTGTGATTTGASNRSYVALYAVEAGSSGATTPQCVESGS